MNSSLITWKNNVKNMDTALSQGNNIGVYDSGLGGLFVLEMLRKKLPQYNYVFLGDEKNLPYGTKTLEELLVHAKECLIHLFEKESCKIVLIACNTLSTTVFDELKIWVLEVFPGRVILGMVEPTIDSVASDKEFILFGTPRTIRSATYQKGLIKKYPDARVIGIEAPLLASLVEQKENPLEYLKSIAGETSTTSGSILLCCTHYGIIKSTFKQIFTQARIIYSQEVSITEYFSQYIINSGFTEMLNKDGSLKILLSKENKIFAEYSREWFGDTIVPITVLE